MLENRIRELASKQSTGPFLSLYLDTQRGDEGGKDRLRVFLKNEKQRIREDLEGNGHDEAIEKGIRQIEAWMENDLQPDTRGVAIFACPTDDVFIPLQLPVTVRPELTIGSRPNLRQLASIKRHHPRVAVALVDAKSARLFELEFGQVLREVDLMDTTVPRRHDQGGWSQSNMQRHVQDHIDRHHKEVAEALGRMVEGGHFELVILSGQDRNLANFRGYLTKRVEERVIGTLHLDIRSSADEVAKAAAEIVEVAERQRLTRELEALETAARSAGRGVLGFAATVDAANQRRLQHLFLSENATARGWRCTACGTLGQAIPVGCPACGEAVVTVELVEELISAAQLEDAELDFVGLGTSLDQAEGAGAILRF